MRKTRKDTICDYVLCFEKETNIVLYELNQYVQSINDRLVRIEKDVREGRVTLDTYERRISFIECSIDI